MVEPAILFNFFCGRSVAYLAAPLVLETEPVLVPEELTVPSGEPDSVLEKRMRPVDAG